MRRRSPPTSRRYAAPAIAERTLIDDVALTIIETGEVTRGRAAVAALLAYLHRSAFAAPPAF